MAKDNKTSKTARVMNLLSKKPETAASEVPPEAVAPAPATPAAAPVPPIVSSMAPDAAVSAQIKNALENTLEQELGGAPAPAEPEPQPAAPVEPDPQPAAPVEPESTPEPVPAPEEAELRFKEPLQPVNPGYINVMQVLVEEKAPKYVQMFGLCSCRRCMEDVKAYTLNHLPPKYVVLEPNDRVPRLTVYEGKFSSDITAQLLQACKVVMDRPHHSR